MVKIQITQRGSADAFFVDGAIVVAVEGVLELEEDAARSFAETHAELVVSVEPPLSPADDSKSSSKSSSRRKGRRGADQG